MNGPNLSTYFAGRRPSSIRLAQIEFQKRTDPCTAVNTAIGNVSLPMHPAMHERMNRLGAADSPFHDGVVAYSATVGTPDARAAFLHVLASSDIPTQGIEVLVTDGGSQAMELAILGICGAPGGRERPLLLIDPAYTNYAALAARVGRRTVSLPRQLDRDGTFSLPDRAALESLIERERPAGMVVIPYDNPTGQYCRQADLEALARVCVRHNIWLISDEAYRELYYVDGEPSSVWRIEERSVPGLRGRRIGIETASKVWNACGLRIGALITDNLAFHERAVAEYTANLCANVIGQYVFGALAHEPLSALKRWYEIQRTYYAGLLAAFTRELRTRLPGVIVSSPEAALYSVVDVRAIVPDAFSASEFVTWCARHGRVEVDGQPYTLLVAPMEGFYAVAPGQRDPGRTQMRVAYVETPAHMALVPRLFTELLQAYLERP